MKRVQVILEEWQHEWLASEAKQGHTTGSALLRQLLSEAIERRQTANLSNDPLWGIIGMAEGPDDGITSENLDLFLYPLPSERQTLRMVAETPLTKDVTYGQPTGDR